MRSNQGICCRSRSGVSGVWAPLHPTHPPKRTNRTDVIIQLRLAGDVEALSTYPILPRRQAIPDAGRQGCYCADRRRRASLSTS